MTALSKIPLSTPDLRGREAEYLAQCVRDNWVSSAGPFVVAMEGRMAELTVRRYAVATVNGTAALHLAVMAANVTPGDLVIVPDWTFAATAAAVVHAGAQPYFVDVTRDTWTLDPELVDAAIRQAPRRVGAVIAVHVSGLPADMDTLALVCSHHGVPLIEDAAGAIGSTYRGRPAGSFGQISCFSFNGNKTVTAGGGGMLLTDDPEIARFVRSRSTTARKGAEYEHEAVGWNYRMTNVNAAIGLAQLERLDEMVTAKQRIAARYDAAIASRTDIRPMPRPSSAGHNCWLYNARVADESDAGRLVEMLGARQIEARRFWRSLSPQAPYELAPRLLNGAAQELSGSVITLPCSSHLGDSDQDRVIAVLNAWQGRVIPA